MLVGADVRRLKYFWNREALLKLEPPHVGSYKFSNNAQSQMLGRNVNLRSCWP